jgi:predicted membrane protein
MESEKNISMETPTEKKNRNLGGRALGGLIVIAVGCALLFRRMHLFIFPYWLFTWPMLLIVIGLFIGIRHGFRSWGGWLILMLIGGVFLIKDYFPEYEVSDYIWPIGIIVFGVYLIFRPRRYFDWQEVHSGHHERHWKNWEHKWQYQYQGNRAASGDDYIESTSIFGGVHKVIVSKNFKGGEVVNIFGGCEINLTQADFIGTVILDFVQIFGGAKIIVPTDWKIVIKSASVFGGVEDKRSPSLIKENPDKTLIIDGTSIFAGVSIQCY